MNINPHIGSSFDDFLEEEGTIAEADAIALKGVLAWQITQAMSERELTKTAMAKEMQTSPASLEELLDPDNSSVTLQTIVQAAKVVGKKLRISLVEAN
ncbi:MAG: XRE family transcriptional regulator [Symploca sp. SIO2G7]|nr:XRE family transcriptional regulator [Symploca sp. SIO2G7]